MNHLLCIFLGLLFFILTPGILVTLPPKGSKVMVAMTHAIVFAVIYCLTYKAVYSYLYEGFESRMCRDAKESGDEANIAAACTANNVDGQH
jgi:hypothetical protein